MFLDSGSVLDSGKCFGFWEVFWILERVFGFCKVFLDSEKCFGFWEAFCPYEPPYIVAVVLFLTSTHLFPTVFYLFQVKGLIFREKKAHRLNRTNDGESQPSNGLNKKNSSALAAYFLVHFKVVVARLSRFPTDAAICSHAAPGHIFDRLKVRAFKGSVQRSNAKVRFKVPCEQSETIERFRVNKVAGQMFEPVENSAASRPLTSS